MYQKQTEVTTLDDVVKNTCEFFKE